jgi:hypothetical protein
MKSINCSAHFLTLKQIGYEESNIAVTFYHDRTHFEQYQRNLYAEFTEELYLQQGRHFVLHNRQATTPSKVSKLKDQVKELDSLFLVNNLEKVTTSTSSQPSNEILNSFFASFGASLSRVIWLNSVRLLLVMQDATLVWLIIDPISGDIIKILTDKTLTQAFAHNSSRLSGSFICDVALISRNSNQSPILALAYLDKSKIDLITFNKFTLINDVLNNTCSKKSSGQNLEKLSTFDPILNCYEFSCPSFYLIEKRFATLSNERDQLTFCLWWPNDGQQTFLVRNQPQQQTISLLERDDLRSNVLVLITNLTDSNLLEYLYKSDGHLLLLSYLDRSSLIAVEQTETNSYKHSVLIYRYDIPSGLECENSKPRSAKTKLISFSLNAKIQSVEQVKHGKKFILMLCSDQTLILYDISRNLIFKHR